MGKIEDYTKIELQETETDVLILTRNGKPLTCPYATRLVLPGQMANTLQVMQSQCGTHCPLFDIILDINTINITLRCGQNSEYIDIGFKSKDKKKIIKV